MSGMVRVLTALVAVAQFTCCSTTPLARMLCPLAKGKGVAPGVQPDSTSDEPESLLAVRAKTARRSLLAQHERKNIPEISLNSDDGLYACHILCVKYSHAESSSASRDCANSCMLRGEADIPATDSSCDPVIACADTVDVEFEDLDYDHNGLISEPEAGLYGRLMCIDKSQIGALFEMVDDNKDLVIDADEWKKAGEDTKYETATDSVVDTAVEDIANGTNISGSGQGKKAQTSLEAEAIRMINEMVDDETVSPSFTDIDKNLDGFIEDWEYFGAFMLEITNRNPGISYEMRQCLTNKFWNMLDDFFPMIDTNNDHKISEQEFDAADGKNNMGDELHDAQVAAGVKATTPAPQTGMNTGGNGGSGVTGSGSFLQVSHKARLSRRHRH